MDYGHLQPKLYCSLRAQAEGIIATRDGDEFTLASLPFSQEMTLKLLYQFNGLHPVKEIAREYHLSDAEYDQLIELIDCLSEFGLLLKNQSVDFVSGIDCLLEIEDLQNKLLYDVVYKNIFWEKCHHRASIPVNVFFGMGIENYHLLFRESWFDTPVLSWQGSKEVRLLMNTFFRDEHAHDALILNSLNAIGISNEEIFRTVPLPETLALCNSLAYWSANDPLFFYTTLGVLEGKNSQLDSCINAMESHSLVPAEFIQYLKQHSMINLNDGHGYLGRALFKNIPVVSRIDVNRLKAQTHLFIDIYNRFYSSIWQHYSSCESLLRLIK